MLVNLVLNGCQLLVGSGRLSMTLMFMWLTVKITPYTPDIGQLG